MSKRHMLFLVIVILFNVLMCYGFVSSKIYLEDFLRSEVNGHQSASWIYFGEPFKIGVGHPIYEPELNLGPLPTYTADYTYVLVLASAIGNVILSILLVAMEKRRD
jgi:hypothetical protein